MKSKAAVAPPRTNARAWGRTRARKRRSRMALTIPLVGRGTEGPEERERRLATARVELAAEPEFDHVIINDDVHRATDELVSVIGLVPRPVAD